MPTRLIINYPVSGDLQPTVAVLACVATKLALTKKRKTDREKMVKTTIHLKEVKSRDCS